MTLVRPIIQFRPTVVLDETGIVTLYAYSAVGTIGDTQDVLITMLVEREGVSGRDIGRVAIPSRNTTNTILSLKTAAFSAAVVNADESLLKKKEGLRTLAFVVDLFPYPFQGFVTTGR